MTQPFSLSCLLAQETPPSHAKRQEDLAPAVCQGHPLPFLFTAAHFTDDITECSNSADYTACPEAQAWGARAQGSPLGL